MSSPRKGSHSQLKGSIEFSFIGRQPPKFSAVITALKKVAKKRNGMITGRSDEIKGIVQKELPNYLRNRPGSVDNYIRFLEACCILVWDASKHLYCDSARAEVCVKSMEQKKDPPPVEGSDEEQIAAIKAFYARPETAEVAPSSKQTQHAPKPSAPAAKSALQAPPSPTTTTLKPRPEPQGAKDMGKHSPLMPHGSSLDHTPDPLASIGESGFLACNSFALFLTPEEHYVHTLLLEAVKPVNGQKRCGLDAESGIPRPEGISDEGYDALVEAFQRFIRYGVVERVGNGSPGKMVYKIIDHVFFVKVISARKEMSTYPGYVQILRDLQAGALTHEGLSTQNLLKAWIAKHPAALNENTVLRNFTTKLHSEYAWEVLVRNPENDGYVIAWPGFEGVEFKLLEGPAIRYPRRGNKSDPGPQAPKLPTLAAQVPPTPKKAAAPTAPKAAPAPEAPSAAPVAQVTAPTAVIETPPEPTPPVTAPAAPAPTVEAEPTPPGLVSQTPAAKTLEQVDAELLALEAKRAQLAQMRARLQVVAELEAEVNVLKGRYDELAADLDQVRDRLERCTADLARAQTVLNSEN